MWTLLGEGGEEHGNEECRGMGFGLISMFRFRSCRLVWAVGCLLSVLWVVDVHGCGKGVCQDYGTEPRFDSSSRPPNKSVLGRATWTVLHTTAAYLPDDLKADEVAAFKDLVLAVPVLYPQQGGHLLAAILEDTLVRSEFDSIKTTEDAQLLVWKLHNAVTAEISPATTPFPEGMGLEPGSFQVVSHPESQVLLGGLTQVSQKQVLDAVSARWVVSGGLKENHWPTRDLKNLPPDRTMLGRAFWTILHTFSVYLPSIPNAEKLAAFRSIFEAIYHVFPCPVCRGHFRSFFRDPILQKELAIIKTKQMAVLFVWKVHNIVTAWGIKRGQWPERKLFPKEAELEVSLLLLPKP